MWAFSFAKWTSTKRSLQNKNQRNKSSQKMSFYRERNEPSVFMADYPTSQGVTLLSRRRGCAVHLFGSEPSAWVLSILGYSWLLMTQNEVFNVFIVLLVSSIIIFQLNIRFLWISVSYSTYLQGKTIRNTNVPHEYSSSTFLELEKTVKIRQLSFWRRKTFKVFNFDLALCLEFLIFAL